MATKPNKNIKVSQATIDKIKKQGMSASLKAASSNNSPEYREALRRMYGDARVAKATASTKPSSSGRYVGSMFVPDKPASKAPAGGQPSGYRNPSQAKAKSDGGGKYVGSIFVPNKPTAAKSPVKKAAASKPKTKPKYGGFSLAANALASIGSKVERTPAIEAEIARRNAKYAQEQRDKKNKKNK
jgi:hypothetical protein